MQGQGVRASVSAGGGAPGGGEAPCSSLTTREEAAGVVKASGLLRRCTPPTCALPAPMAGSLPPASPHATSTTSSRLSPVSAGSPPPPHPRLSTRQHAHGGHMFMRAPVCRPTRVRMHTRKLPETHTHLLEVRVVHVRIHAEEALEDGAGHLAKVGREGRAKLLRKDLVVVDLGDDIAT